RLAVAFRPHGQVQPAASHRRRAGRSGLLPGPRRVLQPALTTSAGRGAPGPCGWPPLFRVYAYAPVVPGAASLAGPDPVPALAGQGRLVQGMGPAAPGGRTTRDQ